MAEKTKITPNDETLYKRIDQKPISLQTEDDDGGSELDGLFAPTGDVWNNGTRRFSVKDTHSANYCTTVQGIRDTLRSLYGEVLSRDLEIKYDSPNQENQVGNDAGDEYSAGFQNHPFFVNSPEFSADPNVNRQPPRNPDGSVNRDELQLRLALEKGKKFNPSPSR